MMCNWDNRSKSSNSWAFVLKADLTKISQIKNHNSTAVVLFILNCISYSLSVLERILALAITQAL